MRVLFIQKSGGPGGSKLSLLSTLQSLHGTDTVGILSEQPGDLGERCRALGIAVHVARLPRWRHAVDRLFFRWHMSGVARRISGDAYDWIISNEMWWAPHAHHLAARQSARSACILRDTLVAGRKERDYGLGRLDIVLAVSDAIRATINHPRCHTLYNIVSRPQADAETDSKLRALLDGRGQVKRWLLLVGKVEPRKNQLAALGVLRRIRDHGHADVGLLLVGAEDPDYGAAVREACSAWKLADHVAFAGHVPCAGSAFRLAAATLCTSRREGLPRVVIESFLSGTPCFSYPLPGIDEILGPHSQTFAADRPEESRLADRIMAFLADRDAFAAQTGLLAERCATQFSQDAHARRLRLLLEAQDVVD